MPPTDLTPERLTELKALHEKATPGEWSATKRNVPALIDAGIHPDGGRGIRIITCSNATRAIRDKSDDDMAAVAALHNAFPALAAELERAWASEAALRAENERLRGEAATEAKRLDYVLEDRVVVIDGCVYKGCDWKTGKLVTEYIGPITYSAAREKRSAIDAARERGR